MKPDILIIGGGVIGSAIAYELSRAGIPVVLLEKETLAAGASGVSAAMLEAQLDMTEGSPFTPLALASRSLFPDLARDLRDQTGVDIGYERCGILRIAKDESERQILQTRYRWQKEIGQNVEWLEPEEVGRKARGFSGAITAGLFYVDDGQVLANRLTLALGEAARRQGAQIREGVEVRKMKVSGGRIVALETNKGVFCADQIVVAAGPWSRRLLEEVGFPFPIEPIRGQLLLFKTEPRPLPFCVYTSEGYITPKPDGITLVGSTSEHAGFVCETTTEGMERLERFVQMRLPVLAHVPYVGGVAGLRPGPLSDNLPAIGPVPGLDNLWVASAHYRNGILLAPITAQLIAASLGGPKASLSIEPFLPARLLSPSPSA